MTMGSNDLGSLVEQGAVFKVNGVLILSRF
jgi:hypothetical protein